MGNFQIKFSVLEIEILLKLEASLMLVISIWFKSFNVVVIEGEHLCDYFGKNWNLVATLMCLLSVLNLSPIVLFRPYGKICP